MREDDVPGCERLLVDANAGGVPGKSLGGGPLGHGQLPESVPHIGQDIVRVMRNGRG